MIFAKILTGHLGISPISADGENRRKAEGGKRQGVSDRVGEQASGWGRSMIGAA